MADWTKRELKKLRDDPNDYPWLSHRLSAGSVKTRGTAPADVSFKSGYVLSFVTTAPNKFIYFGFSLPINWLEGSFVHMDIHWVIPTTGGGGGAENVKWDATVSWANDGAVFPAATSYTTTVDVQDITQDTYLHGEITELDGAGKKALSTMICSMSRDVAVANDYAASAYLMEIDIHFQVFSSGAYFESGQLTEEYRAKKGTPSKPFLPGAW